MKKTKATLCTVQLKKTNIASRPICTNYTN